MSSSRLVHIVDDLAEELASLGEERLTMVVALDGFLDAGNAAARAAQHIAEVSTSDNPVVASFDVDELHDYRARRPAISFIADHYEQYDAPRLVVRVLGDAGDTPYLLLQGPEPDIRWEGFAEAVTEVVERLGVDNVVSLGSVPMAVPHTRPLTMTHHTTSPGEAAGDNPWTGELRVPSSAQALLELRLGEGGHHAEGFVAHIPHYLAQNDYPAAAAFLIEQVERVSRLTIDVGDLQDEARRREDEVTAYLSENGEVREVVEALERQYDTFQQAEASGRGLLASDQPIPTGEELGREFEQFLAGLDTGPDEGDQPE